MLEPHGARLYCYDFKAPNVKEQLCKQQASEYQTLSPRTRKMLSKKRQSVKAMMLHKISEAVPSASRFPMVVLLAQCSFGASGAVGCCGLCAIVRLQLLIFLGLFSLSESRLECNEFIKRD